MEATAEKQHIILRADANETIGWGHLSRLLALADILGEAAYRYTFLVENPSPYFIDSMRKYGDFVDLPHFKNQQEETDFLLAHHLLGNEIVVLDGYNFDTTYQKQIKAKSTTLVCIDDLNAFPFVAEAIINHAPNAEQLRYDTLPHTHLTLGLAYALLRRPFLHFSPRKQLQVSKVFICFGGSTAGQVLTRKVVEVCLQFPQIEQISVIADSFVTKPEETRVKVLYNLSAEKMAELLSAHGLAIVPASTIALEALAAQTILLTGLTADNQKFIHEGLKKYSNVLSIEDFRTVSEKSLRECLTKALASPLHDFNPPRIASTQAIRDLFHKLSKL